MEKLHRPRNKNIRQQERTERNRAKRREKHKINHPNDKQGG